jgi:hypothetical protein
MKKGIVTISALLVAMVFLIVGCTGEVYSYDNFIDDLLDSGASVQVGKEVEIGFFSVQGRNILVNGERIHVFEYDNAALANEDVAIVYPDGSGMEITITGTTKKATVIDWIGPPHFYSKGRLIVIYIDVNFGDDPSMMNLLEDTLGSQFAGAS